MKCRSKVSVIASLLLIVALALMSQEIKKARPTSRPASGLRNIQTLKAIPDCGTVQFAGQTYHTVRIGTQCWLRENLAVGAPIDYELEQSDNGKIERYAPMNDASRIASYGGLYQWREAMAYRIVAPAPGICPPGFHIPSEAEWDTLITFLGGPAMAGGKMKEAGFDFWDERNTGATNESGFSARAAGIRDCAKGTRYEVPLRSEAWFWTDSGSEYNKNARCLILRSDSDGVEWKTIQWNTGISVRCLR